jgi:formylglycine-generating enzyme required for sulfatase activity
MSGNVWELTRSPLQDYPYNPDDDAENLSEDALWVMRGGVDPSVRNNTIGFRVVISKP